MLVGLLAAEAAGAEVAVLPPTGAPVLHLAGGGQRALTPLGDVTEPTVRGVSPDRRRLVVTTAGDEALLVPTDGGPARRLGLRATANLIWSSAGLTATNLLGPTTASEQTCAVDGSCGPRRRTRDQLLGALPDGREIRVRSATPPLDGTDLDRWSTWRRATPAQSRWLRNALRRRHATTFLLVDPLAGTTTTLRRVRRTMRQGLPLPLGIDPTPSAGGLLVMGLTNRYALRTRTRRGHREQRLVDRSAIGDPWRFTATSAATLRLSTATRARAWGSGYVPVRDGWAAGDLDAGIALIGPGGATTRLTVGGRPTTAAGVLRAVGIAGGAAPDDGPSEVGGSVSSISGYEPATDSVVVVADHRRRVRVIRLPRDGRTPPTLVTTGIADTSAIAW